MKIIKLLTIALFSATLLTSCGSKEEGKDGASEEKSGSKLEGTWVIKRATGSMAESSIGITYEFAGDKLTFGSASFKNPGTTEITENTFSFKADGNDLEFKYDYEISGDTLVVKMQGSDQTFYMVKQ